MAIKIKDSIAKQVHDAVSSARKAENYWSALDVKERVKILSKLHAEFAKRKEELALLETRQIGMPITQSLADIDSGLDYFKWYLDNVEKYLSPETTHEDKKSVATVDYEPIGVVPALYTWKLPFSNFIWGAIQNIVVGNVVVYKHSEECVLFGKKLEEIVSPVLPKGIFSEVYGGPKVGNMLVHENVDMICFTGSTEIGQHIYQIASKKLIKVVLELGGSAPGIVFKDADIGSVLESIYLSKFLNCGQVCDGLKRLLAEKPVFDEVVEKLKGKVEQKKVGNPEENDTDIGPLVSEKQLKTLQFQVKDAVSKGAKIITGGKRLKLKGLYYAPTLLTNIKPNMKVWQEEVFGPVLPVVPFSSENEAVKLANDTKYGLGAYIFTTNKEKALRIAKQIKTGMVAINNANYVMPFNPFGGYKKSGIGREHGKHGLRELCRIKVFSLEK